MRLLINTTKCFIIFICHFQNLALFFWYLGLKVLFIRPDKFFFNVMEFVHSTFQKDSYILNVLQGKWIPNRKKQILINYYTFFRVYEINPENKTLTLIHEQPFFSKVTSVDSAQTSDDIDTLYVLTPSAVIMMTYHPQINLFKPIKDGYLALPPLCTNPNYIKHLYTQTIVSSANGSICAYGNGPTLIYEAKTTPFVLTCFPIGDSIMRIEAGSVACTYGNTPFQIHSKHFTGIKNITFAFPFDQNRILLAEGGKITIRQNWKSVNVIPLDSEIIAYCTDAAEICHYLLTANGDLCSIEIDKNCVNKFATIPEAYRIFTVDFDTLLIMKKDGKTVLFDIISKMEIQSFDSHWGRYNICKSRSGELLSYDRNLLHFTTFGIPYKQKLNINSEEAAIRNIIPFSKKSDAYYIVSTEYSTELYDSEFNSVDQNGSSIKYRSDICTQNAVLFLKNRDTNFFFQISKKSFYMNGEEMMGEYDNYGDIICSASNESFLVIIFENYMKVNISYAKNASQSIKTKKMPINYIPLCIAVSSATTNILAVGTANKKITFYSLSLVDYEENEKFSLQLHEKPSSIQFIALSHIIVGLENGELLIMKINPAFNAILESQKVKIGDEPTLCFSNPKTQMAYASSSNKAWVIWTQDGEVIFKPLQMQYPLYTVKPLEKRRLFMSYNESFSEINEIESFSQTPYQETRELQGDITNVINIENSDEYFISTETFIFHYNYTKELLRVAFPRKPRKDTSEPSDEMSNEEEELVKQMEMNQSGNCLVFLTHISDTSKLYFMKINSNGKLVKPFFKEFQNKIEMFSLATDDMFVVYDGMCTLSIYKLMIIQSKKDFQLIIRIPLTLEKPITHILFNGYTIFAQAEDNKMLCISFKKGDSTDNKVTLTTDTKYTITKSHVFRRLTQMSRFGDGAVTSDRDGNIVIYDPPSYFSNTLKIKTAMNAGNVVSGVITKAFGTNIACYSTVFGQFGAIASISNDRTLKMRADFLKKAETIITQELETTTCMSHMLFRNPEFPASNILDLDIIELFFTFNTELKESICKKLSTNTTIDRIREYYNELLNVFNCFYV